MAAFQHHVFAYETDDEIRVVPPTLNAKFTNAVTGVPDEVVFHNRTSENLVFCFAPKAFNAGVHTIIHVESGKDSNGDAVKSQGGKPELYAYQVVAYRKGKKGKGHSDPVLIIEN